MVGSYVAVIIAVQFMNARGEDQILSLLANAAGQVWPPFVLILGLLMIGHAASQNGLFEVVGARLAALPGGGVSLFFSMMALVAVVTALLNLDTSVVFLTPVLLTTARHRGLDERAFLYGAIFMSNAASLLLLGSNLTNILVFAGQPLRGSAFTAAMLPAWCVSVVLTACVVAVWSWKDLRATNVTRSHDRPILASPVGLVGLALATVFMLVLANPALPVLMVGVATEATVFLTAGPRLRNVLAVLNFPLLVGLFLLALVVAVVAREWNYPSDLMASSSVWATATIGALGANIINNLPAAALLSSKLPRHPYALLFGLDLGPNLTVLGAMSSLLWFRVARQNNATPSVAIFSAVGAIVAVTTITAALIVA
jgi:arsenical pump membrane protein